jgi:GST-like protein
VQGHDWSGVSLEGLSHLQSWHDLIAARAAVVRGKAVAPQDAHSDERTRIDGVRKSLI